MTISPRYSISVLVLFALAFIPTLVNSYLRADFSLGDKRMPLIPLDLRPFHGTSKSHRPALWFKKRFHTEDWVQREYVNSQSGLRATLFAARSFETRPLFYLPQNTLLGTVWNEQRVSSETLTTAHGVIPIQMVELGGLGEHRVALYALFYGTRPVANPYLFYLSILPKLLLGHREPMTLIFVDSAVAEGKDASIPLHTTRSVLRAACESFLALSTEAAIQSRADLE